MTPIFHHYKLILYILGVVDVFLVLFNSVKKNKRNISHRSCSWLGSAALTCIEILTFGRVRLKKKENIKQYMLII